ncbi:MAG: hypothetical protein K5696_12380 [Lachnospiraceae bacterium]|nr:hypothetical protein [Lachnospiraceae bacterium]
MEWKADDNGSLVSLVPSEDGKELLIKTLASGIVHVTATATDTRREKPIVLSASVTIVIIDEEQPDPGALKLDPAGNITVEGLKENYEYTGYPVIPDIRVYYGNRRLVMKNEYTITCSNNKRTGTATLVIKGKGNFTGKSQAISYRIDAAQTGALSIKKAVITGLDRLRRPLRSRR